MNTQRKLILPFFILVVMVAACKKKNEDPSLVVSHIPRMVILGAPIISTSVGGSLPAEAGANLFDEDGKSTFIASPSSNNVDLSKPGFYSSTYKVTTKYGYTPSASRLVLVSSANASTDLSGQYARSTNGQIINLTKKGPGLYVVDNIGGVKGSADFIFDVYIGFPTDLTVSVPTQSTPLGDLRCDKASYSPGAGGIDTLRWVVINPNFGTSVRTFIKQ